MQIEYIAAHVVKPATVSSNVGLTVALSLIDLKFPADAYADFLYVYDASAPSPSNLEVGLSKALNMYPEFAGTVSEDAYLRPCIHLTGQGVQFIEASVPVSLRESVPTFNSAPSMLPLLADRGAGAGGGQGTHKYLMYVQVTRFACGGIILGLSSSHLVADGEGACQFFEAWAKAVRGMPVTCLPYHDRSALMQGVTQLKLRKPWMSPIAPPFSRAEEELARKRLQFDSDAVSVLKARASEGASADSATYSAFVSVLAHLWKCIMMAQGFGDEDELVEGETRVLMAVSLRKYLKLPPGYFGNVIGDCVGQVKIKDVVSKPVSYCASHMHAAIKKVTMEAATAASFDFVQHRVPTPRPVQTRSATAASNYTQNLLVISWLGLPLYDLDFGGGTPVAAGFPSVPFDGFLVFTPSPKKDGGIVVDLALLATHMRRFESIVYD